jgi:hypothetical protein
MVFIIEFDQVYSSPNTGFLSAIPLAGCDINNPQDTVIHQWASVMRPELLLTPVQLSPANYIISWLDLPKSIPFKQNPDVKWQLHSKYQEMFYIVEMSLVHIIAKFQQTFHSCKGTSVRFLTSPILSHSPPVHM